MDKEKLPSDKNEKINEGWLVQCPPGLYSVLQRELIYNEVIKRDDKTFVQKQRNHDLVFLNRVKKPEGLAHVRMAEIVLRCPIYGRFKISQRQLGIMADQLKALGPRRLVVSVAGKRFQRQDLLRFINREMSERDYDFDDQIEEEVWMFCIDESWYFGIPVKKARETVGRDERSEEREGSLPAPMAAAIAFAAIPKNDDVVFDPTCGSGTLLQEFHGYAPNARLIGVDIDPQAVKVAKANLNSVAHAQVNLGDSRKLTLPDAKVTLVLANLPFGVQFGSKETNASLYKDIFLNCMKMRDLEKPWRAIVFTSDAESMREATAAIPELKCESLFKIKVRGELATAYRLKLKNP
jgi:hypothetical protein